MHVEIIAEIANAHQGNPDTARRLAREAIAGGADAVKFQVYFADELLASDHPRFDHFKQLEFAPEFWHTAVAEVQSAGRKAYCDVFGVRALETAQAAGADGFKIHASDLGNSPLLRRLAGQSARCFLSVGGATFREIAEAIETVGGGNSAQIVLLHGVQTYPTPIQDAGLARIAELLRIFGDRCAVGYMDHTDADLPLASALPVLAIGLGASVVEKHITLNRAEKGIDYFSSLNPDEFSSFVALVRDASSALSSDPEQFTPAERRYRADVRKRWVAARSLTVGELLREDSLEMKRAAGDGHCPDLKSLVGKPLVRSVSRGESIRASDVRQRVAALVVARMTSSRLPRKALLDVGGLPALAHLFERLKRAETLDETVLCTSREAIDDELAAAAVEWGVKVYRGEPENVLVRMLGALAQSPADIAVRITGDDILVDPAYLDAAVRHHLGAGAEYTSAKRLPSGTETEVFNVSTLEDVHRLSRDDSGTEYLTAYIRDHLDQFRTAELSVAPEHAKPYRLTIDTANDLAVVRSLVDHMRTLGRRFDYSMDDIMSFMEANSALTDLNRPASSSQLPESVTTAFDWTRLA